MTNSVNQPPDKGTGWGVKAAAYLRKLNKKYPAPNSRKKPVGRTGKQGGNYQCQKEKEHTELKKEDPLKNKTRAPT